jgi:Peptidase family M54
MPRRRARKLMLSITLIVIIVAAVSGLVQLSKAITSAAWHQAMQTIALKQGIVPRPDLSRRVSVFQVGRRRRLDMMTPVYGLPPNREVFLERASKEALHETGHTFGLVHYAGRQCAMSLSNAGQIDRKRDAFCAARATRLGRTGPEALPRKEPYP